MSKAITSIKTATLDNKNDNINSSNYNNKGKAITLMDSYKNKKVIRIKNNNDDNVNWNINNIIYSNSNSSNYNINNDEIRNNNNGNNSDENKLQ